jgi:hypothetical protein
MAKPIDPKDIRWKLTLRNGTTIFQSREDWVNAREMVQRHTGEGDFSYRCRAWTVFTGKQVVDWESED